MAGIVLAAGEGKRIGRNKATLVIEGAKSLEIVVTRMLGAGCNPVIVVGGAEGGSVKEEALRLGVRFVLNSDWQRGQFSSLKVGASELMGTTGPAAGRGSKLHRAGEPGLAGRTGPSLAGGDTATPVIKGEARSACRRGTRVRAGGAMVALVDHPFVKKETYQRLVRAFDRSAESIIVPTHHGRRGHPVVVPRGVITEVIAAPDGTTLRDVIRANDNLVSELPVDDAGILKDIDTETDLNSAR